MRIFNIGNNSVNLYLLDSGTHRLLIDSGFPGQLPEIGRQMRKTGFRVQDINYLFVTHFHPDHAGEIEALKKEGIQFILPDLQAPFVEPMEKIIGNKWKHCLPLSAAGNIPICIADSRRILERMNINGEILHTPGHSCDSISIVLHSGEAFTGDLPLEHFLGNDDTESKSSWATLRSFSVKSIFPGHGHRYDLT